MSRSRVKRVSALKQEPIKTPGSPYAVEHGCTCSPLANNYGAGVVARDGRTTTTTFTIAPVCPMHSTEKGADVNTETETLVAVLRVRMENMAADERLALMHSLMDGYCKECGHEDPYRQCQCWNDE